MFHFKNYAKMKRLVICLFVALAAMSVKAQDWYAGGTLSFWGGDNVTSFGIAPEVGYHFNDKWAVGGSLEFSHAKSNGLKSNAFAIAPYARYTFFEVEQLSLFVDGGFGFSTVGVKHADNVNGFEVGFRPGLSFAVTDNLSILTQVGFLGYRDDYLYGSNGGGLSLSSGDLSFGFYYTF